jgi:hypothetical protein
MSQVSTLRKWRFPILIGSGILAACALLYFANARINSEKTQGAIGKRDVYRDGQVDAGSVGATPGTAPVAMAAILEGKEFKSLAKNEAFQSLLASGTFQQLAKDGLFVRLLSESHFQQMAQNQAFLELMKNAGFQRAIAASHTQGHAQDLKLDSNFAAFKQNAQFQVLARNEAFSGLLKNEAFTGLAKNEAFINMLSTGSFQSLMRNSSFLSLVSQSSFQIALLSGSAANMSVALNRQ